MLYFFWFIRICLLSTLSVLFAFIHRLRRDLRNWEFLFWQRSWGHSSVYSVSAALHFHIFQFLRSFYPYRPNLNYIRSKPSIPVYSVLNFIFSSPELLVLTVGFTSTQKHFLYSKLQDTGSTFSGLSRLRSRVWPCQTPTVLGVAAAIAEEGRAGVTQAIFPLQHPVLWLGRSIRATVAEG